MLRHEGVRLHPHGYGQHSPRSLARDLRQWIIDRIDLAEWDNGSSLLHGVSLLREVLAVFPTATIRRLLTPPSPISPHSSRLHGLDRSALERLIDQAAQAAVLRAVLSDHVERQKADRPR